MQQYKDDNEIHYHLDVFLAMPLLINEKSHQLYGGFLLHPRNLENNQ